MKDYKNLRYEEPISLEAKIVQGGAFSAVILAILVSFWL
jgi:hypothetical protein